MISFVNNCNTDMHSEDIMMPVSYTSNTCKKCFATSML